MIALIVVIVVVVVVVVVSIDNILMNIQLPQKKNANFLFKLFFYENKNMFNLTCGGFKLIIILLSKQKFWPNLVQSNLDNTDFCLITSFSYNK
jgi:hypothetical protein